MTDPICKIQPATAYTLRLLSTAAYAFSRIVVSALSGMVATWTPGEPLSTEKGGTVASGGTTVLSLITTQLLMMARAPMTQPSPISTHEPICDALMTLPSPIVT